MSLLERLDFFFFLAFNGLFARDKFKRVFFVLGEGSKGLVMAIFAWV